MALLELTELAFQAHGGDPELTEVWIAITSSSASVCRRFVEGITLR